MDISANFNFQLICTSILAASLAIGNLGDRLIWGNTGTVATTTTNTTPEILFMGGQSEVH